MPLDESNEPLQDDYEQFRIRRLASHMQVNASPPEALGAGKNRRSFDSLGCHQPELRFLTRSQDLGMGGQIDVLIEPDEDVDVHSALCRQTVEECQLIDTVNNQMPNPARQGEFEFLSRFEIAVQHDAISRYPAPLCRFGLTNGYHVDPPVSV